MQMSDPASVAILQGPSHAKYALLCVGLVGELVMGGLMFGWNALSVVLKEEAVFTTGCNPTSDSCSRQDSRLNVVWTAGVFAVNFGLAFAGVSVDYLGPKLTSVAGATMAAGGLIALGFGVIATDLLPFGAFLVGLGGLCFHMSQFHTAQLFPENKGFISSLYVGFFIASGVTFEVLRAIYASLVTADGPAHGTYRAILIIHACLCLPWVGMMLWMNPRRSLKAGQTYHFNTSTLRFVVSYQSAGQKIERTPPLCSDSSLSQVNTGSSTSKEHRGYNCGNGDSMSCGSTMPPSEAQLELQTRSASVLNSHVDQHAAQSSFVSSCGQTGEPGLSTPGHDRLHQGTHMHEGEPCSPSSCDPPRARRRGYHLRRRCSLPLGTANCDGASSGTLRMGARCMLHDSHSCIHVHSTEASGLGWKALFSKPITQQLKSPECIALGAIFIGNVYALQLYLGTARIQLEEMGDDDEKYLQMLSFIVPGVFIFAPFNGFFLDRLGFGVVLVFINMLSLVTAVLQSISVLQLQVVNFLVWSTARYLLYSTFFTAIGTLFSYQSFGRITAVVSVIQALTGLTQLPLTDFAIEDLDKEFLYLHIGEIVLVMCLFIPVMLVFHWERVA